jgi:CheY-like chemotaxis protein
MEKILPVFQHPALTVLVDDSQSFLDSLVFQLGPQVECKSFNDPLAALAWLRQAWRHPAQHAPGSPLRIGFDEDGDSMERRNVSIYLDRIYRMVMDHARFRVPAVLVVDYSMPQMNGVDFCAALKEIPCKKILLTGHAEDKVAIEAFNRKLIDCFLKKGDPDALGRLGGEIARLQREFFEDLSRTLKDLLSRHSYSFLSDPGMAGLVEDLRVRYRFVEHYLFPNPPGILFFDERGMGTLMVIETEEGLTTQLEIAEDQGAPPEFTAALRERRLVPFFSDTGGMYLKSIGENWLQYCLPPHESQGREKYYWALFDLPAHYLPNRVYSYAEYQMDEAGRLRPGGVEIPGKA